MAEEKYTGFEKQLKEALQGHEVAYDPAAWASMEQKLDAAAFKAKLGKTALIAAGVALVGGLAFYTLQDTPEVHDKNIVSQNVIEETVSPNNTIESNDKATIDQNNGIDATETQESNINAVEPMNENNSTPQDVEQMPTEEVMEEKIETSPSDDKQTNNREPNDEIALQQQDDEVKLSNINANFNVNTPAICKGDIATLSAESNNADSYTWHLGDGTILRGKNIEHQYAEAGSYTVKLVVNNKVSQVVPNAVVVNKLPEANFNWDKATQSLAQAPSIAFHTIALQGEKVEWDFGNGKKSTQKSPKQIYTRKGTYSVSLTVTNQLGCSNTVVKMLESEGYNLLAPTGFSPNGDGTNDTWIPVALKHMEADFILKVFNQSGQLVFSSTNKSKEWDGRKATGQFAQPGETFGWVAVVKDNTGTAQEYGGSVTIK